MKEFDKLTEAQRRVLFGEVQKWRVPYYDYDWDEPEVGESNEDKFEREMFRLRSGFDPGPVPKKKRRKEND